MEEPRQIDTPKARVRRAADGIIEVCWHDGAVVDVDDVLEVLEAEGRLMGERALALIDARPVRSMTRAAQRVTTEHAVAARTDAAAILIGSEVSRLLGQFFLAIGRPRYPTRLFTDPTHARSWLLSHRG